tara:strand:- start:23 stop:934 length:912 start_codon:yes stop_codon:yes gene_type:complete
MIDILKDLIRQFMPFAQEKIGFENPPKLFLKDDPENAANPLGKTAFYDPANQSITLYTTDRHPKDVLRSLGHELVHHKQNCEGKFDDVGEMGEGYAQTDPHLRQMEIEANRDGSMCLRDFEDTLKQNNTIYFEHLQKGDTTMSTKDWKNGEMKSLLSEAWGFKMDLTKLTEGDKKPDGDGDGVPPWADKDDDNPDVQEEGVVEEEEEIEEQTKSDLADRGAGRAQGGRRLDEEEEEIEELAQAKNPSDRRTPHKRTPVPDEDEEEEDIVEEDFPGKRDMEQHKTDLAESRLKEIIAYALKTKV